MKVTLLMMMALLMSTTSNALVADKFVCTLEVKDLVSQTSTIEDHEFFMARLPLSNTPTPDVRITASQTTDNLTLSTPKADFSADLTFYYTQALKTDVNGAAVEARQETCIVISGNYCAKSSGGDVQPCFTSSQVCSVYPNPFDPTNGWTPTGIVGGQPAFNQQTLGPLTGKISDNQGHEVGAVNLSCQFLGSYL